LESEKCDCTVMLVSLDEFLEQSQTDIQELSRPEGVPIRESGEKPSVIGRENVQRPSRDDEVTIEVATAALKNRER